MSVEIDFPIEFVVRGTPASAQTKRAVTRESWKVKVKQASLPTLPEGHFATDAAVAVTLFYFPLQDAAIDLDNSVKPVLDAMCKHIYLDDRQVARIWIERYDIGSARRPPGGDGSVSDVKDPDRPALYVRLSLDMNEEFR